jgi:hypothetical protein
MCADAEAAMPSRPGYCYESDCLVSVARDRPVHCLRIDGLVWTEVDDARQLRRAREVVYPRLMRIHAAARDS